LTKLLPVVALEKLVDALGDLRVAQPVAVSILDEMGVWKLSKALDWSLEMTGSKEGLSSSELPSRSKILANLLSPLLSVSGACQKFQKFFN